MSVWGDRDVTSISRREVVDLLDNIAEAGHGVTANRVRAYLSKFFGWCIDRDILAASPVIGVKPVAKESSRDRALSDDEIRWFWLACEAEGFPWGPLGKILLLTGQRRKEVAQLTESELDGALWRLPAGRVKNGRAHVVPLADAVLTVIASTPRFKTRLGYNFTTTGTSPVSGFDKGRKHLAARMLQIAEKERGEPVPIEGWTFHDLRRTAATGMARIGIPVRVPEAVLNHVSGTAGGIVSVYQRHDFADEKRAALEAWSRLVLQLVDGKADKVVQLEARA